MRVAVVGVGHVGLVACVSLAELGHQVAGIDSDTEKIGVLSRGISPFFEPGLEELLNRNLENGRLRFATDPAEAISGAAVVFICVGTPPRASGEANLIAVERAARDVAHSVSAGTVVVEKSTVPAGTADRIVRALRLERPDLAGRIHVVSNPEFLREGSALQDALQPDRILIGSASSRGYEVMRELYAPLIEAGCPVVETDIKTAELAKHACNAFLALKISYINALARLSERAGADVAAVAETMGFDNRIGRAFLDAGMGYGGFCFPKDIQAFERLAAHFNYDFPLLREVTRINDEAVQAILSKVRDALWNLEDKRIALLGLAFKPGTDDVRFAPALVLARSLIAEGASVIGHDPQAMPNAKEEIPELLVAPTILDAAEDAHCVVVCTDWPEFRAIDPTQLRAAMRYPIVVDGRNLFDPAAMRAAGFSYYPTGRPPSVQDTHA